MVLQFTSADTFHSRTGCAEQGGPPESRGTSVSRRDCRNDQPVDQILERFAVLAAVLADVR